MALTETVLTIRTVFYAKNEFVCILVDFDVVANMKFQIFAWPKINAGKGIF